MLLLDHLSGNISSTISRKNGCWMNLDKSAQKETIGVLQSLNGQPVEPLGWSYIGSRYSNYNTAQKHNINN